MRKNVIYVTLDSLPVPVQVNTVSTAFGIYSGPHPVPPPPPIQHAKVHLSVKEQNSLRGICETRMWKVYEITPSATSTQLVVHTLLADAPVRRDGKLSNSSTQFPLETVIQFLKEVGVDLPADAALVDQASPQRWRRMMQTIWTVSTCQPHLTMRE